MIARLVNRPPNSIRRRTGALPISVALQRLLIALPLAACGATDSSGGDGLGGETNWLEPCTSDDECVVGECICGACTAECDGADHGCEGGPPASSCYASQSPGFVALCEAAPRPGVCLNDCIADTDCGGGQLCAYGVCIPLEPGSFVPASANAPAQGEGVTSPPTIIRTGSADVGSPAECTASLGGEVPFACVCSEASPCPTFEQLLSMQASSCWEVSEGCGLARAAAEQEGEARTVYWYAALSAEPVGVQEISSTPGESYVSRLVDLECGELERVCNTCGQGAPPCAPGRAWFEAAP